MMLKRVLITGGFGYLGGAIACQLAKKGFTVRLSSRDKRKSPQWLPHAETSILKLQCEASIEQSLKDVDIVIHLAAMNEIECANNPELAVEINTIGSLSLIKKAISAKVNKFLYFSTIHVYGSSLTGIIDENILPTPTHPYAITHKSAEDFLLARSNDINLNIIRLSNSFGPPMHYNINRWTLLVNDICKQAIITGKIILKSDGSQQRDFITLDDVARATFHLLKINNTNEVYNLGGENTLSILDMANLVADRSKDLLGYRPQIIRRVATRQIKHQTLEYNINKLKKTGFALQKNICEAIDQTLMFVFTNQMIN